MFHHTCWQTRPSVHGLSTRCPDGETHRIGEGGGRATRSHDSRRLGDWWPQLEPLAALRLSRLGADLRLGRGLVV